MAEGFGKHRAGLEVHSAGTKPAQAVDPHAILVMHEIGIDISDQKPKAVTEFLAQEFDYVITVCDGAQETCPVFTGKVKHRLHLGFADPQGKPVAFFRQIRDEIKEKTEKIFEDLNEI